MAAAVGVSEATVRRIWHAHGVASCERVWKEARTIRASERVGGTDEAG